MTTDRAQTIRELAERKAEQLHMKLKPREDAILLLKAFGQAVAAREWERLKPYLQHKPECAIRDCDLPEHDHSSHCRCTCGLSAIRSAAGREEK